MVLMPLAERVREMDFCNSGIKIFFFWKLAERLNLPQGLNCVARVRLEYRPPMSDDFFVIGQILMLVLFRSIALPLSGRKFLARNFLRPSPVAPTEPSFGRLFRST